MEALELVLPPIVNEIKQLPEELRPFYMYLRQAFGPFAQGPVALLARHGDECVFSVDALGLRPLWLVETAGSYTFSSEPGVVPVQETVSEPKPLAPGEKVMVSLNRKKGEAKLRQHIQLQWLAWERWVARTGKEPVHGYAQMIPVGGPLEGPEIPGYTAAGPAEPVKVEDRVLGGFGWQREDMKLVQQMAATGQEPIGSLGYDGPLACLSPERQNLADYFKESVAVVTNPAIDREREVEHFSCRAVFGARPGAWGLPAEPRTVETAFPIILGGHDGLAPLSDSVYRQVAKEHKTYLLEDLWELFRGRGKVLDISALESETTQGAIERLKHEATMAARDGAELLVLSDRTAYDGQRRYIDPHLALAAIDLALREAYVEPNESNLRRRCGLALRSGAIRNVHDVVVALGLGADGVCPYVMIEVALMDDYRTDIDNLCSAMRKGIEKVISTIGIHEVRGYARLFSSIGLKPELSAVFDTPAYFGSDSGGTGFAELDNDADERQRILAGEDESKPAKTFHFYPKVYKAAVAAANGTGGYEEFSEKVRELELEQPVSLRHILDLKSDREPIADSDPGVGLHSYPIVISSMSFGSQGEVAYRSYAEAAMRANIIAMNGEGGEIQDMYGRYPKWRGQQVASGRFGVTSEMVNSSYLVEIKIGQGAKPGEGGHLPAKKVTEKVAQARNASPGTDLISPSNNHDLYSIEDLAELIDELKTANPDVRVSVKVPVVPNIGTIGVGIAKAGADIITLSGFEGGTGAARSHALRHVGLPSDIGTRAVHLALMEAGIRNRVEIWADGGYRHGWDIVKLHCLGANRVGFGTLAMVSLGCTICRGCQLDTCHVGIATQIETKIEADMKGLKKFTPQEFELASENCTRFFTAMGEEVRAICAELGYERAQDLVGRSDLLVQSRAVHDVDVHGDDQAARGVPRPRADRPPGSRGGALGARPGGGAPDPDAAEGGVASSWPRSPPTCAPARSSGAPTRGGRRGRSRARHRARRRAGAGAHLPPGHGAGGERGHAGPPPLRRRLGGGPGPRRLQRLRRGHHGGGRRPGRRGEDDARRQDLGHEGQEPLREAGQRLGGQVVRLRRPARAAVRAGQRRLALLHPALRRGRGDRRRARGAARGRAGLRGRPREHQGLRLRVHDQRPRRGARRPRPLVLRGPDRRARLPARERGLGSHPRGADQATRQGREGGAARISTPRACSTCRSCSATTRRSCAPRASPTRRCASRTSPPSPSSTSS